MMRSILCMLGEQRPAAAPARLFLHPALTPDLQKSFYLVEGADRHIYIAGWTFYNHIRRVFRYLYVLHTQNQKLRQAMVITHLSTELGSAKTPLLWPRLNVLQKQCFFLIMSVHLHLP